MIKFLLTGLPGTGKTTTLRGCVNFLQAQGIDCNFISTDNLIYTRITPDDNVIKQYEKDYQLKIPAEIFEAAEIDRFRALITAYGEKLAFDLEKRFLLDIINSSKETDWFDFGGRALLLEGIAKATEDKGIVSIFLSATPETILARLDKNDGWRQRPTYLNASEKSLDRQGWKILAETHRKERLAKYIEGAAIIISVEKPAADEQHPVLYKSTEEIVQEIFARVKELELATMGRYNQFTNNCMQFFENESSLPKKIADNQQLREMKEWLEANLKRKRFE